MNGTLNNFPIGNKSNQSTDCEATGSYSSAIGYNTKANDKYSTAEGYYSIATGYASHAEGYSTLCQSAGNVINVLEIQSIDDSTRTIVFNPAFNKFAETFSLLTVGSQIILQSRDVNKSLYLKEIESIDTTNNSIVYTKPLNVSVDIKAKYAIIYDSNSNTPSANHAEGARNISGVWCSHVEGSGNLAAESCSHAEGYDNATFGENSHVEGNNNLSFGTSCHAEGRYNYSVGRGSHVEGCYNVSNASRDSVFKIKSFNIDTKTLVLDCTTEEFAAITVGSEILTIDHNSSSSNKVYTVLSVDTTNNSIVFSFEPTEGVEYDFKYIILYSYLYNNNTSASHAEGYRTLASKTGTHSEGHNTTAIGYASHTEGDGGTATGDDSHAENFKCLASGPHSHAEGYKTTASGYEAHTEGSGTIATGDMTHAEGENSKAYASYTHVEGRFGIATTKAIHVEGASNLGIAKQRIFKIKSLDVATKTIVFDDTFPSFTKAFTNLAVGNSIAILNTNGSAAEPKIFTVATKTEDTFTITVNEEIPETGFRYSYVAILKTYDLANGSHLEGSQNTLSGGVANHLEGRNNLAYLTHPTNGDVGHHMHVEGQYNEACALACHVEGDSNDCFAQAGHAEGIATQCHGVSGHTEGRGSIVYQKQGHAEGYNTISGSAYAHVEGNHSIACVYDRCLSVVKFDSENKRLYFYKLQRDIDTTFALITVGMKISLSSETLSSGVKFCTVASVDAATYSITIEEDEIKEQNPHAIVLNLPEAGYVSCGSHAEGDATCAIGTCSHSEGYLTRAFDTYCHAEGKCSIADSYVAHAEGSNTFAYGNISHSEGNYNAVVSGLSHIEGNSNIAGIYDRIAKVSAYDNTACTLTIDTTYITSNGFDIMTVIQVGDRFVAVDLQESGIVYNPVCEVVSVDVTNKVITYTSDNKMFPDGPIDTAKFIPGFICLLKSSSYTLLGGHAEGDRNTLSSSKSHAEGQFNVAKGTCSHVEGKKCITTGYYSHAQNYNTQANGEGSHAEGCRTIAEGDYSHAGGNDTKALAYQYAIGHYNNTILAKNGISTGTSDGTAFVIGNGTSSTASNAIRMDYNGKIWCKQSYSSTGADYAEYFEWEDSNTENEDRVGRFVTFSSNDKISIANSNDEYILGIVSGQPAVIGNQDMEWSKQFMKDEFGRFIVNRIETDIKVPYEVEREVTKEDIEYTIVDNNTYVEMSDDEESEYMNIINEKQPEIVERHIKQNTYKVTDIETRTEVVDNEFYKVNPDYDPTREYVCRDSRPEWSPIGMLGVLSVYDDGTCEVGKYCKCGDNGIAIPTDGEYSIVDGKIRKGYKIISRVSDNIIKVLFR